MDQSKDCGKVIGNIVLKSETNNKKKKPPGPENHKLLKERLNIVFLHRDHGGAGGVEIKEGRDRGVDFTMDVTMNLEKRDDCADHLRE